MTAAARMAAGAAAAFATTLAVLLALGGGDGTRPAPEPQGAALARGASTTERVQRLEATVRAQPRSAAAHTTLAAAYLQQVRETGDTRGYDRADAALRRALALKPGDAAALTERGVLRLGRHQFGAALDDAQAARAAAPEVNKPFGVLVDALVELGRYPQAARALQQMIDRKPNVDAYGRAAYLRELRGDLAGAERALRLAIAAGGEVPENTAYVQSLLGDLELVRGRPGRALTAYRAALRLVPGHTPSQFGTARARAAQSRLDAAIRRLTRLVDRAPSQAYAIALGEAQLAAGRRRAAAAAFRVAEDEERKLREAGETTDLERALYEADHGTPALAVSLARRAVRRAPSIRASDALGWALTRAGRPEEGLRHAQRALRLGSREPLVLYHAGVAASRAGERALAARLLGRVVRQAPRFSPYHGPRAARALERL